MDSDSISLQISGHLRRGCVIGPARAHVRACQARFSSCEVFVHTWTLLEPSTPHWRRGYAHSSGGSSATCVARLRAAVQPISLLVEHQPAMPANGSLGPDGQPFAESEMHWGPQRHWGWRMNVHGMQQAAALRHTSKNRNVHALSIRLRPDDIWRFGKGNQVEEYAQAALKPRLPCMRPDRRPLDTRRTIKPQVLGVSEAADQRFCALCGCTRGCSPNARLRQVCLQTCLQTGCAPAVGRRRQCVRPRELRIRYVRGHRQLLLRTAAQPRGAPRPI